jgi:serine/threonine-protein kinase
LKVLPATVAEPDYAHRHGVIHRDLKPENILLHEGQPLAADFGIALAVSKAGGNRITQTGLSLGTPQYMSPEQAIGDRVIDARTDIYSIATVVYEMLTGEPPHVATTAQAIVAKILTEEPRSVRAVRPHVAEHVDAAIMCALAKLPADRFATVKEFADALNGTRVAPVPARSGATALQPRRRVTDKVMRAVPWTVALAAVAFAPRPRRLLPDPLVGRFSFALPSDARMDNRAAIVVSPDGGTIVYRSFATGKAQLFARRLNDVRPRPIAGTEGAGPAFFSPDGAWLGFTAINRVMKVPIAGGAPSMVARRPEDSGGSCTWGSEDIIVCGGEKGLAKVSAAGGDLSLFTHVDSVAGDRGHRKPTLSLRRSYARVHRGRQGASRHARGVCHARWQRHDGPRPWNGRPRSWQWHSHLYRLGRRAHGQPHR